MPYIIHITLYHVYIILLAEGYKMKDIKAIVRLLKTTGRNDERFLPLTGAKIKYDDWSKRFVFYGYSHDKREWNFYFGYKAQ